MLLETSEPVKGRGNNGGRRYGYMEKDGTLRNGCAYVLLERLMKVSDITEVVVCSTCWAPLNKTEKQVCYTFHARTACNLSCGT